MKIKKVTAWLHHTCVIQPSYVNSHMCTKMARGKFAWQKVWAHTILKLDLLLPYVQGHFIVLTGTQASHIELLGHHT